MKNLKRFFTFCAISTSVMFTSCVSEDISPFVEELRSAQADYLVAQTALEQAKAVTETAQAALLQTQAQMLQAESEAKVARMAAETALMETRAAYEAAIMESRAASEIADLEMAVAQAQYERDLLEAKLAAETAEFEAMMTLAQLNTAQAQLAMQEAIDALAGQINETAKGYLDLYQNSMMQADNKLNQITSLRTIVSRFEANMDPFGNVLDFNRAEAELEAQIAGDLAKVESLEDAIGRLEGLNANVDGVRNELTQVINSIEELEKAKDDANLEADRVWNILAPFNNKRNDLDNSINQIEFLMNTINYNEGVIANLTPELEKVVERLEPYQVDLEEVEGQLTTELIILQGYLDTAQDTWYNLEYVSLNGTPTEIQDADDANEAAKTIVINYTGIYQGIWNDAANYVYYPNSGTEFGDAVLAVSKIEDYATYNNLVWEFNNYTNQLVYAQNQVMWRTSNLEYWQDYQNDILSFVGVDTVDEFWIARGEAYTLLNEKYAVVNKIQDEVNILWDLRWKLYYYLNDPNRPVSQFDNQISDFQNQIAILEDDIEANQDLLIQNAFEAEEMAAMYERTQDRIDRLMTEYNALVDLANEYLEKFNDVLENN